MGTNPRLNEQPIGVFRIAMFAGGRKLTKLKGAGDGVFEVEALSVEMVRCRRLANGELGRDGATR